MKALELPPGAVHLWQARLDLSADELSRLAETLSPDEQVRAARYRFEVHRRRFVAARGRLRRLVGQYLDCKAEAVRFQYSPCGKPAVVSETDLRFNLSHSEEVALYAFARGCEVGIDVERIRETAGWERIAERYFAPGERAQLEAVPPELRTAAFFQLWTRKEAYLKARGEGLRFGRLRAEPDRDAGWWVVSLEAPLGYAAALAVEAAGAVPLLRRMGQPSSPGSTTDRSRP